MAETCARIQEMLSAYLDGRLSPEETARVAGHLELCPECAALLEKMRKLDSIAASAVDDIDDAILDKLEQRIRTDIEALPTVNIEQKSKLTRVTPVWYRYVAAAASIVLVFMIGRAVYKSGSLDEWLPFGREKTVKVGRPPSMGTQPPAPAQIKPATETPPEPTERKAVDQAITTQPKPIEAKRKAAPEERVHIAVPETKMETTTVGQESKHDELAPTENIQIVTQSELKDVSRDKETTPSERQGIGTSIEVQAVPEAQSKETDSKVAAGESRSKETALEMAPDAASTIEKKAGQLKAQAVQELGKLGYNNAIAPVPAPSAQTTATLQSRYDAALAEYKPARGIVGSFMVKPKGSDSTAAARYVLGRANSMPESNDLENQAVKLYLTARAQYDLYRFTGEKSDFDQAVAAKDSLMRLLDRFAGDPEKGQTAKAYRDELQRLSFQE